MHWRISPISCGRLLAPHRRPGCEAQLGISPSMGSRDISGL
jgi:hypothetical protein